ncbi:ElyC/SanA/YdcF family protein [Paracidovorax oryzae]|uniref:ElyC/SanA/YdcF family protein n=1 Tax=Paracidovorax oryzae TaxID=862720 RepID=UPI0002EF08E2|nr:ElyC/SanA/YdcF family protein [Paracidovorax oryzae]
MTMTSVATRLRPGGRSARVQAAVHQAVRDLTALHGRDALTIPQIAAQAGVTPSTIYRRWGDLAELLADVSIERMRDEAEPPDTGSFRGDLLAWGEQFLEEMSSGPGRQMLKDVLSASGYGDGSAPCPAQPQALVAVCGGIDLGETESEAAIMARYLRERHGIAPGRIVQERESTSTELNIALSRPLLQARGVASAAPTAIVTSDFHLMRATRIARRQGLTGVVPVGAPTPITTRYNAWLREYFAMLSSWALREI